MAEGGARSDRWGNMVRLGRNRAVIRAAWQDRPTISARLARLTCHLPVHLNQPVLCGRPRGLQTSPPSRAEFWIARGDPLNKAKIVGNMARSRRIGAENGKIVVHPARRRPAIVAGVETSRGPARVPRPALNLFEYGAEFSPSRLAAGRGSERARRFSPTDCISGGNRGLTPIPKRSVNHG